MTDEEAEAMLEKLSRHYNEPVMPVKRYCSALETWAKCIVELNEKPTKGFKQGYDYYKHLYKVFRDIKKSNLLWRLIYEGEELRTEPCPQCNGEWNGQVMIGTQKCQSACEDIGWLHKGWQLKNLLK